MVKVACKYTFYTISDTVENVLSCCAMAVIFLVAVWRIKVHLKTSTDVTCFLFALEKLASGLIITK